MSHTNKSRTRLRRPEATSWETVTIQGVRVATVPTPTRERILSALAQYQLLPAPVAASRGGPTFLLEPWSPGGMEARQVVLSAIESGLAVIATFGVGMFGTPQAPRDQRVALVSMRQIDLARSDSGWLLLNAPARRRELAV